MRTGVMFGARAIPHFSMHRRPIAPAPPNMNAGSRASQLGMAVTPSLGGADVTDSAYEHEPGHRLALLTLKLAY
jgi:hypothetical protein